MTIVFKQLRMFLINIHTFYTFPFITNSGHANGNAFEIEDGKIPSSENTIKKDLKNFKFGSAINRLLEETFIK